jgi:hypothetical protein
MKYNPNEIDAKWQKYWQTKRSKPKTTLISPNITFRHVIHLERAYT